jgi:hypothetical protein
MPHLPQTEGGRIHCLLALAPQWTRWWSPGVKDHPLILKHPYRHPQNNIYQLPRNPTPLPWDESAHLWDANADLIRRPTEADPRLDHFTWHSHRLHPHSLEINHRKSALHLRIRTGIKWLLGLMMTGLREDPAVDTFIWGGIWRMK